MTPSFSSYDAVNLKKIAHLIISNNFLCLDTIFTVNLKVGIVIIVEQDLQYLYIYVVLSILKKRKSPDVLLIEIVRSGINSTFSSRVVVWDAVTKNTRIHTTDTAICNSITFVTLYNRQLTEAILYHNTNMIR